ncbi:hypothetical protein INT46_001752 [Mucor plumbeus]|uniref:pyridoxal kinase n=1 Tax=Mucor plumbeus TaxID=97098 RepID=A0A8H7UQ38_9FUNG|nr:hypothetical protein INT46_001752 [Mucor plumbeus]
MTTTSITVDEEQNYRVLSIQSHTVSGYCGNKAAVFPLQTLGFDVDNLNTVQFSNHTGYPSWTGSRTTAQDVQDLFDGLENNELIDEYTHVLTGYIGNFAILETIQKMVKKLKAVNPNLIYLCDTVMGDGGALYVAPEIVPLYRNIMRYADVVTPNQFEAETLSEMKITSLEEACQVAKKLHSLGSPNVVITSLSLSLKDVPVEIQSETSSEESLYCLSSQQINDGTTEQYLIAFPTYEGYFTGTGDLFSSLTVAHFAQKQSSLIDAVFKVICSVNAITRKTYIYQQQKNNSMKTKPNAANLVRNCELRLIQGKKEIEEPELYKNVIKKQQNMSTANTSSLPFTVQDDIEAKEKYAAQQRNNNTRNCNSRRIRLWSFIAFIFLATLCLVSYYGTTSFTSIIAEDSDTNTVHILPVYAEKEDEFKNIKTPSLKDEILGRIRDNQLIVFSKTYCPIFTVENKEDKGISD